MKKVIRLTEYDLTRIVKRVIKEQEIPTSTAEIKKFQDWMDTIGPWVKSSSGKYVKLNDSVNAFQRILAGEFDSLPEQAFYLVGGIEDVIEKAKTLAK